MYNIQKFQCELYKYSSKKTEVETSYILRDTILQERYLEIQNTQQFNNISQKIFYYFFLLSFSFLLSLFKLACTKKHITSIIYIVYRKL